MAKQIRKQNKGGVAVSLGRLAEGFAKGIGGILGFAADLEKQGKSEYEEHGEIEGKTSSGKKYKGAYGFRVKVGLNPEDFSARGGSALGGKGQKRLPAITNKRKEFKSK